MKVEVRPMYVRGKPLSTRVFTGSPAYRGKLSISENRLHALSRVVTCARLTNATDGVDSSVLPEMTGVQIL